MRQFLSHWLFCILVTAIAVPGCPPAAGPDDGDNNNATARIAAPPAGQYYHGVYPGGQTGAEDDITSADLAAYTQAAGRSVAWVYFSHNWYNGRQFPLATAAWVRQGGAVPYIRLMLRSSSEQNVAEPVYSLQAILAGQFDADLDAWGDAARDFGTPLLAEWGTEMNGEWFSWNGVWNGGATEGPGRFREAYRRIVERIRARGANNITWVFHVNANDVPDESWNAFENYYPGDEVIDWLGLSSYGAQTPMTEEWPIFADAVDACEPRLRALAHGKPVYVLEFGVTAGNPLGDPATWAADALDAILANRWPSIRGFSWWNETWQNDDNPAHDTDMRVQTVSGLPEVFQDRLGAQAILDRPILP